MLPMTTASGLPSLKLSMLRAKNEQPTLLGFARAMSQSGWQPLPLTQASFCPHATAGS